MDQLLIILARGKQLLLNFSSGQVLAYFIIINLITFIVYSLEKSRAISNKWRVSELALFILAYAGGGIAAFVAMEVFNHKTRKVSFKLLIPWSIIFNIYVFGNSLRGLL